MDSNLEIKLVEMLEKAEIRELIFRYADVLDGKGFTEENIGSVLAEDAELVYPNGMKAKGFGQIIELSSKMDGLFVSTNHDVSNELIELVSEDKAAANFHFNVVHKLIPPIVEQSGVDLFTVYDRVNCEVIKDTRGWRFSSVTLETVYSVLSNSSDGPPIPKA